MKQISPQWNNSDVITHMQMITRTQITQIEKNIRQNDVFVSLSVFHLLHHCSFIFFIHLHGIWAKRQNFSNSKCESAPLCLFHRVLVKYVSRASMHCTTIYTLTPASSFGVCVCVCVLLVLCLLFHILSVGIVSLIKLNTDKYAYQLPFLWMKFWGIKFTRSRTHTHVEKLNMIFSLALPSVHGIWRKIRFFVLIGDNAGESLCFFFASPLLQFCACLLLVHCLFKWAAKFPKH